MCPFSPNFRYGLIFRTNVASRPVIISANREFNYYILKQVGTLVDTWSLDTFAEVFDQVSQSSRKYNRNLTFNHFGVEALKDKLIPKMEDFIRKTLRTWSSKDTIELKGAYIKVTKIKAYIKYLYIVMVMTNIISVFFFFLFL